VLEEDYKLYLFMTMVSKAHSHNIHSMAIADDKKLTNDFPTLAMLFMRQVHYSTI